METDEEQYERDTSLLRLVAYGLVPVVIIAVLIGIVYLGVISFS